MNKNWVIWGRPGCSYCDKALALLKEKGQTFQKFDVRQNPVLVDFMEASGMPLTVPQVFLNGHLIGGYDELSTILDNKV